MTGRATKARIAKAKRLVQKWREPLKLDPKWEIDVLVGQDVEYEDSLAVTDLSKGEYFSAKIELYPKLTDDKEKFDKYIEPTIIHELLHIVLWPMGAYIYNKINSKEVDESIRAEEMVCTHLEKILCGGMAQ